MSETVEFEYKYQTFTVAFFTILFGAGLWGYIHDALAHPDIFTWGKAVLAGAVFIPCALNLIYAPLSDKMLRLTETELQIPWGWVIKRTVKIPFNEIEKIELSQSSKTRIIRIFHRKKIILIGEEKLPNAEAFETIHKVLYEGTRKYIGLEAQKPSTQEESLQHKKMRDFTSLNYFIFGVYVMISLYFTIPLLKAKQPYALIIMLGGFLIAQILAFFTTRIISNKIYKKK